MLNLKGYVRSLLALICCFSMQTALGNVVLIEGPWKEFKQPDGTTIKIKKNGDSNDHWFEDENGYVLKIHNNALYYQLRDSDHLIPIHAEIPSNAMISSEKWAKFSPKNTKLPVTTETAKPSKGKAISGRFQVVSVTPTQPLLIIALSFNDSTMTYSKEQHLKKFYGPGSLSEYFLKASFQGFSIVPAQETQGMPNDGYIAIKLNNNQPEKIGNQGIPISSILADILKAADSYIDFSAYDTNNNGIVEAGELAITIIVAGWEAIYNGEKTPNTWGHWSRGGNNDTFDGVRIYEASAFGEKSNDNELFYTTLVAHELGHHILRLPDLYEKDGGTSYNYWGVMGASFCCKYNNPLDFSGWSKDQVGFLKPRVHKNAEQQITLKPSHKYPEAYKIWIDPYRHNEYLLLEFKVQEGINKALRHSGLLVSHIAEYHSGFNFLADESTKSVTPILDNGLPYGHSKNGLTNVRNKAGVMTNIAVTDIQIKGTTTVSAKVSAPIEDKSSIGHNEAPHFRNASTTHSYWGDYWGDRAIIMEIANSALYADGIDLPNLYNKSSFLADVRIATSLQAIEDNNYLYSGQCHINKNNWNRCLFPSPIAIKDVSPLYVYIQYKDEANYVTDPGPISNKFYEYFPKRNNIPPSKLSGRDISMRLLVSGLSPNSPPTFSKTSIDIPVEIAFSLDKSKIDTYDPDGDDANVSVTHLSTTNPSISIQKVQQSYVITAPKAMSGQNVQAQIQLSDGLDVTQGTIELRFVGSSQLASASGNAPEEPKKEKKKGGGSFQIHWTIALLLLFITAFIFNPLYHRQTPD